jgi:hypothetical protein
MADTHYLMARGSSLSGDYKVVHRSNASNYRKQGWDVHGSGSKDEMQDMKGDWDQWHNDHMQRTAGGPEGWRPTD